MGTWMRVRPWLFGLLLSALAMMLGWSFGSGAAELLGGEPGIWARTGKGLVWGAVVAGLQWPIVRAVGVPPLEFVAASALCFAAGYPLGQTVQGLMLGWHWIWGYGSALAVYGLSLGLPQWWVLRGRVRRASLWILFSVIGWELTGVAWISFGGASGEDSLLYGLVTGPGLVWLARPREPSVHPG